MRIRNSYKRNTRSSKKPVSLFESFFRKSLNEDSSTFEDELDDIEDSSSDDAEMNALEKSIDDEEEASAQVSEEDSKTVNQIAQARQNLIDSVNEEISEFDGRLKTFINTIEEFNRFLMDVSNEESIKYFVTHSEMFNTVNKTVANKSKERILDCLSKASAECGNLIHELDDRIGKFDATEIVTQQLTNTGIEQ